MKTPMIIGAGLAGLIAAHAWPTATVLERMPQPLDLHRALLRFRSDSVARLTSIPFRSVKVRKGIWFEERFCAPSIRLANFYSQKCLGKMLPDRSIWNLDPVQRWIAPDDFYQQMLDNVGKRVVWGQDINLADALDFSKAVVSTAPLPITAQSLDGSFEVAFDRAPIVVQRFLLEMSVDVHQTIYFPDPAIALYRASITGRTLILEYAGTPTEHDLEQGKFLAAGAFGFLGDFSMIPQGIVRQQFGKIAPIDDALRKHILFRLTHERGIYSLGRFATWRNILLDDVVQDIDVIKSLMRTGSYELNAASSRILR